MDQNVLIAMVLGTLVLIGSAFIFILFLMVVVCIVTAIKTIWIYWNKGCDSYIASYEQALKDGKDPDSFC
jgi:hypothetical protein